MPVIASTLNRLLSKSQQLFWAKLSLPKNRRWLKAGLLVSMVLGISSSLTGCRSQAIANPRRIAIEQTWELAPGDAIEGFSVAAGLGDISIHMRGKSVHAPFQGDVELSATGENCIFFSSPEVPAYLFRYCGLRRPQLGTVGAGQSIGHANFLHFATLRRQPEGTWVIVEPSKNVLERSLERY
ncbi:MAG: hypothetical protein AAFW75_30655 [Cyanobacteria bacterium J06636_16]